MLTRHRIDFELQPTTRWYAVQTRPARAASGLRGTH
jgi:hypothetical protein